MADLEEKIQAEFVNIATVLSELPSPGSLADRSQLELAGVSAFLHNFYNGVENVLKQKLMAMSLEVPTGPSWHRDLLNLCAAKGVISQESRTGLAPYLAFRHFFSHGYAVDLDAEKLATLVENIRAVYDRFRTDIADRSDQ